jgi:hypothetical protein
MIWLDSFGKSTTQGGYETFVCTRGFAPSVKDTAPDTAYAYDTIDFCSDAGSGYKSTHAILGL